MELIHDDNETERLQDLKSYAIMDTLPELSFDQLTTLAARVCQTPIALLSFIDEDRQWFKSTYGITINEIPRHISACNQTINQEGVYEIPDATVDMCPYQEYMQSLGLRYYAGVPIVSRLGHNVGTLCVIDKRPRQLTADQILTLQVLSEEIVQNLELRKKYRENLEKLDELGRMQIMNDKKILDVAYKRSHKSIAELSSGLNYRVRPFVLNILTNTRLLLKEDHPPESKARLKSIEDSSKEVMGLFDKLEQFVTAEKEKWMKVVELNGIINEVVATIRPRVQEKKIEIKVTMDPDLRCIGNYTKLFETFFSIIRNAVDAVSDQEAGKIEVILKHEDRMAILRVKDNGHGISNETKSFIFQPFFTTKSHPSLGIGLSLAKSHIEEHLGTLEVERAAHPTVFKLTIPLPA